MTNAFLYHGTDARYLESIRRSGLLPRASQSRRTPGNFSMTSNRKAIYLTDAYAAYFTVTALPDATETTKAKDLKGLILEIPSDALRPDLLCPDEDYLEQASRNQKKGSINGKGGAIRELAPCDWDMTRRTRYYRKVARSNPHLAAQSLEGLGTVAYYGSIPWKAIRRYAVIDFKRLHPEMVMKCMDPSINIFNYAIMQGKYKTLLRWIFGEDVTLEEMMGPASAMPLLQQPHLALGSFEAEGQTVDLREQLEKLVDWNKAALQNRDGIQVISVREEELTS
jgi:hypothetical protein